MRRLRAESVLLAAALAAAPAWAQVTPVFTAPLVQPAVPPEPAPLAPPTPQAIVRWFEQACVETAGQAGAAIDWALANGFAPVDPLRGDAGGLLEGQPGTVLAAPGAGGRVMLAAAEAQCTLWAEQTEGPPLRQSLAAMVGTLSARGAKARVEVERNLERAGAWRSQVQWRYRAVGASQDLGIGAVTTLAPGAGTQVLLLAPLARAVNVAPDGQPVR